MSLSRVSAAHTYSAGESNYTTICFKMARNGYTCGQANQVLPRQAVMGRLSPTPFNTFPGPFDFKGSFICFSLFTALSFTVLTVSGAVLHVLHQALILKQGICICSSHVAVPFPAVFSVLYFYCLRGESSFTISGLLFGHGQSLLVDIASLGSQAMSSTTSLTYLAT
ncbi:hypothetical protein VTN00DRAFT_249 [Thermoascus crustaceus]|uniref:uncharacterized protein n=1 Tax=Thermoascus crustaceus TaxID=5088 RepID=UPI0037428B4F